MKKSGAVILFLAIFVPFALSADAASVKDIQTAYIYNFAKFIQWPQQDSETLNVCVYGNADLADALAKLEKKSLHHKKINVVKTYDKAQISSCQMLVLPSLLPEQLAEIRKLAKQYHIVTISDKPGYAQNGVMINFFIDHKKVRFEINHKEAQKADIVISSKLLRIAKVVTSADH